MLTKKQRKILNYIKKFIGKKQYSPSLEEIRRHFKLSSKSTAHYYIEALREKGYLNK
ncbi:LexA repressor, partial [Patescibacteria group bacterium]|nr:LexA repressor [Patescibacteria group bacterium]